MRTLSTKITLYASDCHSLKEKRQILQSVITKTRNKFNASISEVDFQEDHQTMAIGVAVVSGSYTHAQKMLDEVVRFIENYAEAETIKIENMD